MRELIHTIDADGGCGRWGEVLGSLEEEGDTVLTGVVL